MRSTFTSILFLLIITNCIFSEQLLKLPVLFKHFTEHRQLDHRVSIAEYLAMHYGFVADNDDDTERDMQLPFKKMDAHFCHVFFLPENRSFYPKPVVLHVSIHYPLFRDIFISAPDRSAPFRPPCS